MLKKTIKYTDFNGEEREEDFYFNFTKAELAEMELSTTGGIKAKVDKIVKEKDQKTLIQMFKDIVLKAYGEKSSDGRRFIKNDEIRNGFEQTEAYSILFMELATDSEAAANFFNGIIPQDISEQTPAVK